VAAWVGSFLDTAYLHAGAFAPRMAPQSGQATGSADTWVPLLLVLLVAVLVTAVVISSVRMDRRPLPPASRRTLKAVSWRFADAVERGDFDQAEAEVARLFERSR
jgi:hypothetical protein